MNLEIKENEHLWFEKYQSRQLSDFLKAIQPDLPVLIEYRIDSGVINNSVLSDKGTDLYIRFTQSTAAKVVVDHQLVEGFHHLKNNSSSEDEARKYLGVLERALRGI